MKNRCSDEQYTSGRCSINQNTTYHNSIKTTHDSPILDNINDALSDIYGYYYGDSDDDYPEDISINDSHIKQHQSLNTKTIKQLTDQAEQVDTQFNKFSDSKPFKNFIKHLVSKKKKRYETDEFSLDLTYITPNVIAMGYPADKMESLYRNNREDVKNFFKKMHGEHYKIYNLCSEREYDQSEFPNFAYFPFEDHQAPEFSIIYTFCKDLFKFIHEEGKGLNTVGVHCKAGKGRTGVMICCYLMYCGFFEKAIDSLRYYGLMRTKNKKGVTIPSQIRYVQYFEKVLQEKWDLDKFPQISLKLLKMRLVTVPNFNLFGGCEPSFTITFINPLKQKIHYSSQDVFKLQKYNKEPYIEFILDEYCVSGDVFIAFFNKPLLKKNEKMFQFWFNCAFFEQNGVLLINKTMLDSACKDSQNNKFSEAFHVEVHAIHPKQSNQIQYLQKGYLQHNQETILAHTTI